MLRGVPGSSPITDPRLPPKRTRSKGPFLRQHDLASPVVWPSPTPVRPAACATVGLPAPSRDGSPPMTRTTLPPCRAPYPGGSRRVPVSIASPLTRPSPFPRRVGIRIFTFEACSGFTRVTARWIAQPPKAAFVTRLQPSQLPDQTARQLPEQSTTLRVEPSSTGDTRRRGALGKAGHRTQCASDRNLTLEGDPCLDHVAVLRRPVAGTTEAGAGACNRHIALGDVKEPHVRILTAQKVTINRVSRRNRE